MERISAPHRGAPALDHSQIYNYSILRFFQQILLKTTFKKKVKILIPPKSEEKFKISKAITSFMKSLCSKKYTVS